MIAGQKIALGRAGQTVTVLVSDTTLAINFNAGETRIIPSPPRLLATPAPRHPGSSPPRLLATSGSSPPSLREILLGKVLPSR
jgi:hypothetical protein